ncbi:hypothetical protein D3C75_1315150 [compost metagenome]
MEYFGTPYSCAPLSLSGWLSNRLIAPADKVRPRSKRYDTSRSVTHCGLKVWSSAGLAALRFFHSP